MDLLLFLFAVFLISSRFAPSTTASSPNSPSLHQILQSSPVIKDMPEDLAFKAGYRASGARNNEIVCQGLLEYQFKRSTSDTHVKNAQLINSAMWCHSRPAQSLKCYLERPMLNKIFQNHYVHVKCSADPTDARKVHSCDKTCRFQYKKKSSGGQTLFQVCCCYSETCKIEPFYLDYHVPPKIVTIPSPYWLNFMFVVLNFVTMSYFLGPAVVCFVKFFEQFPSSKLSMRILLSWRTSTDQVVAKLRHEGIDPLQLVIARKLSTLQLMSKGFEDKRPADACLNQKQEEDAENRRIRGHYRALKMNKMVIKLSALRKGEIEQYKETEQDRLRILQFLERSKKEEQSRTSNKSNIQKPEPPSPKTAPVASDKNEKSDDNAKTPPC